MEAGSINSRLHFNSRTEPELLAASRPMAAFQCELSPYLGTGSEDHLYTAVGGVYTLSNSLTSTETQHYYYILISHMDISGVDV